MALSVAQKKVRHLTRPPPTAPSTYDVASGTTIHESSKRLVRFYHHHHYPFWADRLRKVPAVPPPPDGENPRCVTAQGWRFHHFACELDLSSQPPANTSHYHATVERRCPGVGHRPLTADNIVLPQRKLGRLPITPGTT